MARRRRLLPISIVGTFVLIGLGTPRTLSSYVDATTLEGATQTIAMGPVASQEIINVLGTNGGSPGPGRSERNDGAYSASPV